MNYLKQKSACWGRGRFDDEPISTPFAFRHCDKYLNREKLEKDLAEAKLAEAELAHQLELEKLRTDLAETKECLRRAEMSEEEKKEEDAEAIRNGACPDW